MTKEEFLGLMRFPAEWKAWGMYPEELFHGQLAQYEPGDERGSEHDRNGAFHWWLKRNPDLDVLWKLQALAKLDPDRLMAQDAQRYILRAISRRERLGGRSTLGQIESRSGSLALQVASIHKPGDFVSRVVSYDESGATAFRAPPAVVAEVKGGHPYSVSVADVGTADFTLTLALIAPAETLEGSVNVEWDAILELE